MSITYKIDADKSTIQTKAVGNVTLQEVVDHFRTLEQDPQTPERTDVFLDLSEVDSLPETPQISTIVGELKRIRGKVRFNASPRVSDPRPIAQSPLPRPRNLDP